MLYCYWSTFVTKSFIPPPSVALLKYQYHREPRSETAQLHAQIHRNAVLEPSRAPTGRVILPLQISPSTPHMDSAGRDL